VFLPYSHSALLPLSYWRSNIGPDGPIEDTGASFANCRDTFISSSASWRQSALAEVMEAKRHAAIIVENLTVDFS
jgi:hypothetical protein